MFTAEFLALLTACTALVMSITEAIKKWVGAKGVVAVVISVLVSAVVCLVQGITVGFEWGSYLILFVATVLQANGWFQFVEEMAERKKRI